MPKGVRRELDPGVDAPPDMAAWFAGQPAAALPAEAVGPVADRVAYIFNLVRAAHAQGRRVNFEALARWDLTGPFEDVLSRQKIIGMVHGAVWRKWAECPADRVFYLPACGEHLLMDSPNRSVQGRRQRVAEELGCGPFDAAVTEKLVEGALIHAGRRAAQADGGELLAGAGQRDATVQIVRRVLGPMYDRERWVLAELGLGLLRLMAKHKAAAVYAGGVLVQKEPRLAVMPQDPDADLRWVYVPGLRSAERLPERWARVLFVREDAA